MNKIPKVRDGFVLIPISDAKEIANQLANYEEILGAVYNWDDKKGQERKDKVEFNRYALDEAHAQGMKS